MSKQKIIKQSLNEIDLKIMELLQTEKKELTLKEIVAKTGEAPQKIVKSLWKLFVCNDKLRTDHSIEFHI